MAHNYINGKLNKAWRNNYTTLIARYCKPELTEDEIVESLPHSVNSSQFLNRMKMHFSEKGLVM